MFSGLNNFVKYILPKRLFYRALIIVAAPTIILQIIITIVFYDSVWIKANKNITRSLVNQLKTIEEVYQNDKKNLDFFTDSYKNNFNFEIGISQEEFPQYSGERKFSPAIHRFDDARPRSKAPQVPSSLHVDANSWWQ